MAKFKMHAGRSRVFHGPVNIAGIARHLADWQRSQGLMADSFSHRDSAIVDRAHVELRFKDYGVVRRAFLHVMFFLWAALRYDVFHFYFGRSLLPLNLDMPLLKLLRRKVVMTYCGSDIRQIAIEHARNPYAHLLRIGRDHPKYDRAKRISMRWHRLWCDRVLAPRNLYASAREVFPEQMVEKRLWVHNTMDLSAYAPLEYRTGEVPVIVHAPSEPGIKGTEYIEAAVERLRARGVRFEFRLLTNRPHAEVQRLLRDEADIVLDQLLIGGFGSLAVEGMYYGKPVVAYILDSVRAEHFPDCPIVSATIDDLTEQLGWLIEQPERRVQLGRQGRAFVERYLDRDKIGRQVLDLYAQL